MHQSDNVLCIVNAVHVSLIMQAKTTKKIVLRLSCQQCKAVHMHPIKVCRLDDVAFGCVLGLLASSFAVSTDCLLTAEVQAL